MGLIFDKHAARLYETWFRSPHGRAVDSSAERLIIKLLDPRPGERLLDIGCGDGNHLLFFSRLGLNVSGIDASPYMINRARARLDNRCTLKTGLAQNLPFDDNEFDVAVLINTLEFLDEPVEALREAGRVAARKVFVGVMNNLSFHWLRGKFLSYFRESLFAHVRSFNVWDLLFCVRMALGPVPIIWSSDALWPGLDQRLRGIRLANLLKLHHCPFGSFIALSANIVYTVRTDNLSLKIAMGEAQRSIAGGITVSDLNSEKGVWRDEGSLPV
jgi:SAM-dependent methyltransferase